MPPAKKTQPSATERDAMLNYLASRQPKRERKRYRRLSRHEFMNSVNDLVGVELDLREKLPEDRDTHVYDSSSEILLTKDLLAANFDVADEVLDYAFPVKGFGEQQTWTCKVIQRSNHAALFAPAPRWDPVLLLSPEKQRLLSVFLQGFC